MREGWEYKKLGDIVSFCSGSRPQGGVGTISEGALSLGGEHIGKDGHISLSTPKYVSLEYYTNNSKGHIEDNDILLCKDGALTGKVAILRDELKEQKAMVNEHVFILRSVKTTQPFLFYYLYSPSGQIHLKQRISGAAQGGLNGANLKTIPIPIPPLSVQQQIVSELDLLSSVIEKQKAQIEELDKLAQSIFYDMFGDPVENEKGWEVKKLGEVISITSKLVDPNDEPYCNQYHVGPANIVSGTGEIVSCLYAKEENLISGKYAFKAGMVLYSKIRPNLNKVAIPTFDGICSADMYPLSVNDNAINTYIQQLLSSKEYLKYAVNCSGRARMPKINREALFDFEFSLPPLSLQQEFANKIQAIESMKAKVRQSLKESEMLFNSRMDFYFS